MIKYSETDNFRDETGRYFALVLGLIYIASLLVTLYMIYSDWKISNCIREIKYTLGYQILASIGYILRIIVLMDCACLTEYTISPFISNLALLPYSTALLQIVLIW